jgi:hypothetical protein
LAIIQRIAPTALDAKNLEMVLTVFSLAISISRRISARIALSRETMSFVSFALAKWGEPKRHEPRRVCRRPFRLSHAAMAGSPNIA